MPRPPRPLAPDAGWGYALDLLGRRALTAAEVAARLRRRGIPDPEIDRIVGRLRELRLLDDAAYAAAFVRGRAQARGRAALRRELRRKGVAEPLVDAALAGGDDGPVLDDAHQAAAAAALLRKHRWRFAPRAAAPSGHVGAAADRATEADGDLDGDGDEAGRAALRRRARAAAFLARRGFAPDAVQDAIAEVLGGSLDDATEGPP